VRNPHLDLNVALRLFFDSHQIPFPGKVLKQSRSDRVLNSYTDHPDLKLTTKVNQEEADAGVASKEG
jgi:hypothetical protein